MRSDFYQFTAAFPDEEINKAWDRGEQIQAVAFSDETWVLFTTNKLPECLQRWATNGEFPSSEIKEGWDNGFDIIFLEYVNDRWVVIQSKDTGFTDQIWRTSSRFPEKEINQGIKDGYSITNLAYGDGRWAVVMSKGCKLGEQTFELFDEFPEDAISKGWSNNQDVTALAFGEKKWALVMSAKTGYKTQSWATRNKFDAKLITDKLKAGNEISCAFYADDMWNYVFTTFGDSAQGIPSQGAGRGSKATLPVNEPDAGDIDEEEALDVYEKGRELANNGKHKKAIELFRKSVSLNPNFYLAHNSLGVSLDIEGEKDEALECFRKAFELSTDDPIVLSNLVCQIVENQESVTEIVDAVEKAGALITGQITNATAFNNIAFAYAEKGDHKTAIEYYDKSLAFEPDNEVIRQNREESVNAEADSQVGIVKPESNHAIVNETGTDTVEFLLKELNKLTGLAEIKRDVETLIQFIRVEEERRERGFAVGATTLHTVFAGPPGTGKTTMARLMGRFFKALGILKKGHVVEVDRSALVGEFIGQTAIKTNKIIDSALDGILFIDEAYSLVPKDSRNDFGEEVINTLVKRMEDHKHNLIVIVAGYEEEMKRFIKSNTGLKHRFTRYFYFKDYTPAELTTIFESICAEKRFILTFDAQAKVKRYFEFLYNSKDKQFGNARSAKNLFEEAVRYQSARLGHFDVDNLSDEELLTIQVEDIGESVRDEFEDQHIETVEEVLAEFDTLVGLTEVKESIHTYINYIKTQQMLLEQGLEADNITLHSVFFGPPGTGKTTVARLLGRVFKALGLLTKGHLVEVGRQHLVGEFIGHTAPKTNEAIDSAMYGVLFIDEAYSLAPEHATNDFGREAIEVILKRMDDERDKFAVIVAGYTREMQRFISSNSGLESRFTNYFFFNDYNPDELLEIFVQKVKRKKFEITADAVSAAEKYLTTQYNERTASFGNGRMVRNFYEKLVRAHSNRIATSAGITREEMITFTQADIEAAIHLMVNIRSGSPENNQRRPIGYK